MTEDKDFKRLVRDEARRSGRRYTEVRQALRPGAAATEGMPFDAVAERFEAIVATLDGWIYGQPDVTRLVAVALLADGNVLFTAAPGAGMTALAKGLVAAIGGRLVPVDGRTGLDAADVGHWGPDDVVAIHHLDGLDPAAQVVVVTASHAPAIVLAKRHPVRDRMPFPPDDDIRDRFLIGAELRHGDVETELRIVGEARNGSTPERPGAALAPGELTAMRAAVRRVEVPHDVRRAAVEAIAETRRDGAVLVGASTVATLDLVRAASAVAASEGRSRATADDVRRLLRAVLDHRVVRS